MRSAAVVAAVFLASVSNTAAGQWKPVAGKLMTRWAKDVRPDRVWTSHPNPQMVRREWQNLNGLWDYAVAPRSLERPMRWDGKILVPFAPESALSGVGRQVGSENRLWYRREFALPAAWKGRRVLLHFGAVEWEAQVRVNNRPVGEHHGGYDPFTLDITAALKSGSNRLEVAVWDPSDEGWQPRGKQVRRPEGIWYTPVTGIWQTVWLEPVAPAHITSLRITPDLDSGSVEIEPSVSTDLQTQVRLTATWMGREVASWRGPANRRATLKLSTVQPWSPEKPNLYDLWAEVLVQGRRTDIVSSYFGLRKISIGKDSEGRNVLCLNNRPYFQFGPLDQGYWPDGLYTPPTETAMRYDIEMTKKLGFNMARKHVKVEPALWYAACDRMGLLVWQDMPSGDAYIGPNDPDIRRSAQSTRNFEREWGAIMDSLHNHPSIVMWVPFNEGWGQFDTARIAKWTKDRDPSRLVNSASGWTDRKVGDVHDLHIYPGPGAPSPESGRAGVLGEFGGLGLPVRGHTWQDEKNWGYRSYTSAEALTEAYITLINRLVPLRATHALSAAVYTQTTDVEIEVNGLLTYDREIVKMPLQRVAEANRRVYGEPGRAVNLLPDARVQPGQWSYTTQFPGEGWQRIGFGTGSWKSATSGFGTRGTPGSIIGTVWNTSDIWLRRMFSLSEVPKGDIFLSLCHDEDVEIYLNGSLIHSAKGHIGEYTLVHLGEFARRLMKPGDNLLAVHCRQTSGGQYIDAGLLSVEKKH
jgi:hypothetical protein